MRLFYFILLLLFCGNTQLFSQQITVDDSVDLESLIQDNLVDGCVDISNINSSVNGSATGLASYAYFERGSSNFPFERGIMLSTGAARSGGNSTISPTLSEGSNAWGTDPDLEAELGVTGTENATSIEFDFVSISNQFQFNYIFASEEYSGTFPCNISDGFVFLIKEAGSTSPYQNIAVIPGTTTPVNTNTIYDGLYGLNNCPPSQNPEYFEGYNLGDTNYNGRTTVLTASGTIQPNVTYHIKLIIADQNDSSYDSAVFIEGDSFRVLELGEDITTCASSAVLNADLENPLASYAWYLNGNPIPGAISSTHTALQNGTYRVEVSVPVSGSTCIEEDEINVTLNTEEPIDPITDYELCDDASGDEIEVFDLSTKNAELEPNIPFTNYDYSYHYSEAEARANSNPITSPISNTINPQPIFVRIQDLDSPCFSYTSFNLMVHSLPDIVAPTPLETCDGDDNPDGYAIIDLTEKDDEITQGNPNLLVTYHYNTLDASTGNNPIPSPYINTNTPTDNIFVRVVNTATGCVNNTTLQVNIEVSPIVNRDIQYLDACDRDLDGSANFDLTEVIAPILNGLTDVTTTFHTTLEDAQTNTNIIANETNYEYNNAVTEPGSGTIYLRIEDNDTGCATIVPFEIHTNLLLTGTDTGDYALCDNNDDETDTLDFNLFTVESYIANDLPYPIAVTFYETEDDRDNGTNALPKTQPYAATSPQVLYITIENTDSGCVENSEITLLINPILLFDNVTVPYCDDDNDGFASIDLASLDDIITGGNEDFTVRYYASQTDAENTQNQLPPFYNNTNPVETLYARIENENSGCSTVNPFEIEVLVAPATNQPTDIIICDDDQDGFFIIDLNAKISEVVSNTTDLGIDFFTSLEDADAKTNEIPETDRNAYNTNTQTIFVRVEDLNSPERCYAIESFEVIVNTLPDFPVISNYQICEDDNDHTAEFLLSEKDDEILNGQTGKEVFYFEDPALTNMIPKDQVFTNSSSPQTIYVRVENITDPSCFDTSSFILQVSPTPVYSEIEDFLICDDDSNDGRHEFNLAEKAQEIQSSSPDNLNILFFRTEEDAENQFNPLPNNYTNEILFNQTIYARIESDDSLCYIIEPIYINIQPAPNMLVGTPSLFECAPDYNGQATFDLTFYNLYTQNQDFEVLDRIKNNLRIDYFENETDINPNDGLDNTNAITDPENFVSEAKTVYIKVANILTGCYTVVPLQLNVNLPPPTNTVGTVEICDNDTNTYDLSFVDNMIVDDPSVVNISYHDTQTDAEDNTPPLNNIYNYINSNHTLYVRVSNPTTGCFIVQAFILQINENPIANTPPDLIDCNDDYDNFLVFDLTQNNSAILGSQNASNFNITFYNTEENAESGANRINNSYQATDGETIFVRVQNISTGCFSTTQFSTRINPLPIIPINDIVPLCNDEPMVVSAETGVPGDTYLWSTGATSAEILIGPNDIGNYSVTVTRPNTIAPDCSYTHNFSVVESDQATINFTQTVDFADPNSITVDVSGIGNYVFILDDGEPQTSNVFENVSFGPHLVTVRDLNGCLDVTREVFVIDIPKFFTPNNDGAYDTWHIVGVDQLPGTMVYIYNRYGKLLKTLPHTSMGWDGTFNGQNMPSDDYWFVAKIMQDGESFDIKGHFALKR